MRMVSLALVSCLTGCVAPHGHSIVESGLDDECHFTAELYIDGFDSGSICTDSDFAAGAPGLPDPDKAKYYAAVLQVLLGLSNLTATIDGPETIKLGGITPEQYAAALAVGSDALQAAERDAEAHDGKTPEFDQEQAKARDYVDNKLADLACKDDPHPKECLAELLGKLDHLKLNVKHADGSGGATRSVDILLFLPQHARDLLRAGDLEGFKAYVASLFAGIFAPGLPTCQWLSQEEACPEGSCGTVVDNCEVVHPCGPPCPDPPPPCTDDCPPDPPVCPAHYQFCDCDGACVKDNVPCSVCEP